MIAGRDPVGHQAVNAVQGGASHGPLGRVFPIYDVARVTDECDVLRRPIRRDPADVRFQNRVGHRLCTHRLDLRTPPEIPLRVRNHRNTERTRRRRIEHRPLGSLRTPARPAGNGPERKRERTDENRGEPGRDTPLEPGPGLM